MILAGRHLTVDFPVARGAKPHRALDDVSFSVASGELVAVVGPNGSGKTSLLRTLLGLITPTSGDVTLGSRAIAAWSRRELAETIGALPQREAPAFPLTVREAVLMGRWAALGPVAPITTADHAVITEALGRCDIAGFEERGIDTLSGGEWQRVRLARALAATPQLLLLDEPTAALDVGHEMELLELLRRLVRDGLGVLVITHQLNLAARYADRIVLLDRGRAVADGVPANVLTAAAVSAAFQWPVAVTQWRDGSPQVVPLRKDEIP
ncbi:MAG TPA: ABC transporter ATP-binding protein [Gemmatimonadales bacterium]|jgi:iron complex transport system ATP-binding protein